MTMSERAGPEHEYHQPALLEAEAPEETELDNCLVLSRPEYKDTGKKQEWVCEVYAQPSIFQPETDMVFRASASNSLAAQSKRKSLKPGDRAVLTGIVRSETVTYPTGITCTIHHLSLTRAPQLIAREKRVSTTVYEQQGKRSG